LVVDPVAEQEQEHDRHQDEQAERTRIAAELQRLLEHERREAPPSGRPRGGEAPARACVSGCLRVGGLNSRIPRPSERPISGSRFGPKISSRIRTSSTSSQGLTQLGMARA